MWRLLLWLVPFGGFSQIQFQQALKPLQLIPRTTETTGTFQWRFQVTEASITKVSLVMQADKKPYRYIHQSSISPTQQIQFNTTLEAKPQEYSFLFYVHRGRDSTLAHQVDRVVCGDFIVLYGQSNMVAQADYDNVLATIDDRVLRNFTFAQDIFQEDRLTWFPSKQPYGHTGGVGLNLQKRILEETGIPTCVINSAQGGASIVQLFDRNTEQPNDLRTQYGRLITRIQRAGANGHIRAFLWRQGENELCGGPDGVVQYPLRFTAMWKALQQDVGFHGFFYNVQLAIQSCFALEEGGMLRDWIRRTPSLFPNLRAITAIGVPIYDGAHHDRAGYEQLTGELYRLIRHDLYNRPILPEEIFPTIQRIERKANGLQLDLIFQENQRFRLPNDSILLNRQWRFIDHFYINQLTARTTPTLVERVTLEKNRVQLHLKQPVKSGFVTYLPSYLTTDPPFIGAVLTNRLGRRALSFYQFPIQEAVEYPFLDSVSFTPAGSQFHIRPQAGYSLEAQRQTSTDWISLTNISGMLFQDNLPCPASGILAYRFRWVQGEVSSDWSPSFLITCQQPEGGNPEPEKNQVEQRIERIRTRNQRNTSEDWLPPTDPGKSLRAPSAPVRTVIPRL